MKKVSLVCAGKIKERFLREGIDEYAARISRFADFSVIEVKDFPPPDEIKR